MDSNVSKMKNLKVLYEQRRERIQNKLEYLNLTESMVSHYLNLKSHFGVVEGVCVFLASLIVSYHFFNEVSLSSLLSLSLGFGYVSAYNGIKYKKMQKLRDENPDVDFDNYDFDVNFDRKNQLHAEIQKIDNELLAFESAFNYEPVDVSNDYISYVDTNYYDFSIGSNSFTGYESASFDNDIDSENSYVFVKKLERK